MTGWEQQGERSGSGEPEIHSFVLRARRDPQHASQPRHALRIRLEQIEPHQIWHFGDIASALAELQSRLEIIAGALP